MEKHLLSRCFKLIESTFKYKVSDAWKGVSYFGACSTERSVPVVIGRV